MSIGAAVGAITFSGSIIAFLKLRIMSGAPITFSGQHLFKFNTWNRNFCFNFLSMQKSVCKYFGL